MKRDIEKKFLKLCKVGLTRNQLREVAGGLGMDTSKTCEVTRSGVTKCCW